MTRQTTDAMSASARRTNVSLGTLDAHFEVEEIIAEGDTVAVRFAMTGVHAGEFLGIPATGKKIRRAQMTFFHIRDGKIADSYSVSDMYGMMFELNRQQP